MPSPEQLDQHFPRIAGSEIHCPVWCCTPNVGRSLHRFFDTSPISPDGRHLAVFRMPFEDRLNRPGDRGEVVLVDLQHGGERIVSTTAGWEPQMGCNLNWAGDQHLVFNDVDTDTWTPQIVRLDISSGQAQRWPGGVYQVSPDGRTASAASMEKMRRTQLGYGVLVPDEHSLRNVGAREDDGLFMTNLDTGERELVASLADTIKHIPELRSLTDQELRPWEIYGFHSKWSPVGDRLIFTVRRYLHEQQDRFNAFDRIPEGTRVRFDVFTCRPDGSELCNAVPAELWNHGGHHINFFPDGQRLSANIRLSPDEPLSLIEVGIDGNNFHKIINTIPGSGHPTVHPNGRHLLTDTYAHEDLSFGDGSVPLRWIDLKERSEQMLVRTAARVAPENDRALRVDPHPAWDRSWRWFVFNGTDTANTRRVYLADMDSFLN